MRILALESSATAAGAAVLCDGKIISEAFICTGLTHSQTLLTLVSQVLQSAQCTIAEMDALAVSAGPGSFTGVRIGVSALKGLAFAGSIPCYAVSTLEAMSYLPAESDNLVCPVMDARCSQVYTALFTWEDGKPVRLLPDSALSLEALSGILKEKQKKICLIGDGTEIAFAYLKAQGLQVCKASAAIRYQHAAGVAIAAYEMYTGGIAPVDSSEIVPSYLRLSQAERERINKNNN